MKVLPCKKWSILALLLLGFSSNVKAQTGGGSCMSDSVCNFASGGGFCNLGPNSCTCVNGYTGSFCQTAPASPAGSSTEVSNVSNVNNVVLLATLGAFLFIFLRKERNREDEDWIFYQTLYQEYLFN